MNPTAAPGISASVPVDEIAERSEVVDRDGRFPSESFEALRAAGLLSLGLPETLGGAGGGPREVADAVEQVSAACASTGMIYLMHLVATQTLVAGTAAGDDGPKADALAAIASGEHLTTLAYSEFGSRGHFWAQVSRPSAADGDGVVVDADKSFSTGAGEVDSYVLATGAVGSDDPIATDLYLVDAATAGLSIPRRFDGLGLRGNASAPLALRGVRIDADRRLGDAGAGFGLMMTATLPWFVLGSAACSVGIAGAAIAAASAHATGARLEHLDHTLAAIPGVRARLARARIRHREARALLYEVADAIATGAPDAQEGVLALKASAAEAAIDVTDMCMRIGGGAAYAKAGPLERHLRDARAAAIMAPTTDLLHDFLGKALTGQELF